MNNLIKNLRAKCIERDNPDEYVMHEVSYQTNAQGEWVDMTSHVVARDPQHAIELVYKRYI
jgi:hypothetical protein